MKKRAGLIVAIGAVLAFAITAAYVYHLITSNTAIPESSPAPPETKTKYEIGPPDAQEMLELANEERAKAGVAPLQLDERLNRSAEIKANDMNANSYFAHENPVTGKQGYSYVFDSAPGTCVYAGENIYLGLSEDSSQDAIDTWIDSKAHYDAMINAKYTLTGFGVAGAKVVQHFCQVE